MKSLKTYISEKLVINKQFKNDISFSRATTIEGKIKGILKDIDPELMKSCSVTRFKDYNNKKSNMIQLYLGLKGYSYTCDFRLFLNEDDSFKYLRYFGTNENYKSDDKNKLSNTLKTILNENGIKYDNESYNQFDININNYDDLYNIFNCVIFEFIEKYSGTNNPISMNEIKNAAEDLKKLFHGSANSIRINKCNNIEVPRKHGRSLLRILPCSKEIGWCAKYTHDVIHNRGIKMLFSEHNDGYFKTWEELFNKLREKYE